MSQLAKKIFRVVKALENACEWSVNMIQLQSVPNYQQQMQSRIAFKGEGGEAPIQRSALDGFKRVDIDKLDTDDLKNKQAQLEEFSQNSSTPKIIAKGADWLSKGIGVLMVIAGTRYTLNKSAGIIENFVNSKNVKDLVDPLTKGAKEVAETIGGKVSEGAAELGKKSAPLMERMFVKFGEFAQKFSQSKLGLKVAEFLKKPKVAAVTDKMGAAGTAMGDSMKVLGSGIGKGLKKVYTTLGGNAEKLTLAKVKNFVVNFLSFGAGTSVALVETGVVKKDDNKAISGLVELGQKGEGALDERAAEMNNSEIEEG